MCQFMFLTTHVAHANTEVVRSNFLRLQFVLSGILHVVEQGVNLEHGARNKFPFWGIL
jgi:hypothetical protein